MSVPNPFELVFQDNELLRADQEEARIELERLVAGTEHDHAMIRQLEDELASTGSRLNDTEQKLERTQADLDNVREERDQAKGQIEERDVAVAALESMSRTDALTDLPNRRAWNAEIERHIAIAERHNTTFAVLLIDVDSFKLVNDTLGHAIGDKLLKVIAKELRLTARPEDTIARLGGDEIAMLIEIDKESSTKPEDQAGTVAKRVRTNANQSIDDNLPEVREHDENWEKPVDFSVGIAIFKPGDTPETLQGRSDADMYRVKRERGAER